MKIPVHPPVPLYCRSKSTIAVKRCDRLAFWALAAVLVVSLSGCMFFKLDKELTALSEAFGLTGTIAGRSDGNTEILVVVYQKTATGTELYRAVIVNPENGRYSLEVEKGMYYIGAFADLNNNLKHDTGEPAGYYGKPSAVEISEEAFGAGKARIKDRLDFSISAATRLPRGYDGEIVLTSDMVKTTVIKTGELIGFDDDIMAAKYGSMGYWQPMTFLRKIGYGIFFLEEYDNRKTPLLFVHGAAGTPVGWRDTVAQIDRNRYQPWFFYYPSGLALEKISTALNRLVEELHGRYGFKEMVVVAQSMGGLVSRSFILKNVYESNRKYIKMFVSVSTPWNGHKLSEKGVKQAPTAVPSWHDMIPGSDFINSLYEKRFPPYLEHHLFFTYKGDCSLFMENNDGTVELSSQLDYRAQTEAERIFAFNEDHDSIVQGEEYLAEIHKLLGK